MSNLLPSDPNANSAALDQLREYCDLGWRLVPFDNFTKASKIGTYKDNRGSNDFNQIKQWYHEFPGCRWGWLLADAGYIAVDVDPRNGFRIEDFDNWPGLFGFDLPETRYQLSGGGGLHAIFRLPEGATVHGKKLWWSDGHEVKGIDVIYTTPLFVEPSPHPSGGNYRWTNWSRPIADAPQTLLDMSKRSGGSSTNGESGEAFDWSEALTHGAVIGRQQDVLYRAACSLRARDETDTLAVPLLRQVVSNFINTDDSDPWTQDAADKMWQRVKNEKVAGRSNPVTLSAAQWDWAHPVVEAGETEAPFILTAAQVRDRPKLKWFVEDVMPERALFQLYGPTGAFKTFVVIDLLGQVANGSLGNFLGKEIYAEPGLCCMVLGEGGGDIGERVDAWCHANPGLSGDNLLYIVDQDLDLLNGDDVNRLGTALEQVVSDRGLPLRMIVFDTQADHLPGGDERDEKTFSQLKPVLLALSRGFNACVGLVHHTGWNDERERGSSRQRQMLDVVIDVNDNRLKAVKVKAGPKFDDIPFATRPVGDSLVVHKPTEMEQANNRGLKYARDAGLIVQHLEDLHATATSPVTKTDLINATGLSAEKVRAAASSDSRIGCEIGVGRGNPTYYWLIEVEKSESEMNVSESERQPHSD